METSGGTEQHSPERVVGRVVGAGRGLRSRPAPTGSHTGPGRTRARRRRLGAAVAPALLVAVVWGAAPAAPAGSTAPAAPAGSTAPADLATDKPPAQPASDPGPVAAECLVVGASRAGRAWLPRARVAVRGARVLLADVSTADARAVATGGLVEVQRTSRRSPAAASPVVLQLLLLDTSGRTPPHRATCALAGTEAPAHRSDVWHGVRRLAVAD